MYFIPSILLRVFIYRVHFIYHVIPIYGFSEVYDTMSQTDQEQDQKSMDKKEIAEEEREKMLNAENTKHTGSAPASDLESEEQKPKRKIPIGGIKMPGFCRTKSKEPCKVKIFITHQFVKSKREFVLIGMSVLRDMTKI